MRTSWYEFSPYIPQPPCLTLRPSLQEKSGDERSDAGGSQGEVEDYDVDEEYDNDYAENYFDSGENDDMDNLGDGGGDDGGGTLV